MGNGFGFWFCFLVFGLFGNRFVVITWFLWGYFVEVCCLFWWSYLVEVGFVWNFGMVNFGTLIFSVFGVILFVVSLQRLSFFRPPGMHDKQRDINF